MSMLSKTIRRFIKRHQRPVQQNKPRSVAHSSEVRGQSLYFVVNDSTAQYEPQVLDYIDKLPVGAVFYDLGACVGFFSLYAAARGLQSFAFEVESKNFSGLEANVAANPRLDVRRFQIGISDGAAPWADLRVGQDHVGGHHKTLVTEKFSGPANIVRAEYVLERVRVAALDQWIVDERLPLPQHMKIDIDGSEVLFVRGARRTLANAALRSVMFELYEDSPYWPHIIEELQSFGFRLTAKHPLGQPWPGCERLFNCEFWK